MKKYSLREKRNSYKEAIKQEEIDEKSEVVVTKAKSFVIKFLYVLAWLLAIVITVVVFLALSNFLIQYMFNFFSQNTNKNITMGDMIILSASVGGFIGVFLSKVGAIAKIIAKFFKFFIDTTVKGGKANE